MEGSCCVLKMRKVVYVNKQLIGVYPLQTYHGKESLHSCLLHIRKAHRCRSQNNEYNSEDTKERNDGFRFTEQADEGHQEW